MSKRHLLPPENEEYLERLGLSEIDSRIYSAVLDSGLVSIGEIVQLTELDLGKILVSVRDLVDLGLLKKAIGKMPRYFAVLPFFKETMSIEKETALSLNALITDIKKTKKEIEGKKEKIARNKYPKIIQILLDSIYDELLSPLIKDLNQINVIIDKSEEKVKKSVQDENMAIRKEIDYIISPVETLAKLQNQTLDISIIKRGNELEQLIQTRKAERLKVLKTAHNSLGKSYSQLMNITDSLIKEISNNQETIIEKNNIISEKISGINNQLDMFLSDINNIVKIKDRILGETIVVRQRLMKMADTTELDPLTNTNIKRGVNAEDIFKEFNNLASIIKKIEVHPESILQHVNQVKSILTDFYNEVQTLANHFEKINNQVVISIKTEIESISNSSNDALNLINKEDDISLNKLKVQLNKEIENLRDSIKNEGNSVLKKISSHQEEINNDFDKIFSHWEKRIVSILNQPKEIINPFISKWKETIKPFLENFKSASDEIFKEELISTVEKLEKEAFGTLITRVQYVKAMVESRSRDLQSILKHMENFDYHKSSDTWVVVGIRTIYATLTDLLVRTKRRVTLVLPRMNTEILNITSKLKQSIRITIAADFDLEKDERLIKKAKADGRTNLRRYPGRDLYACIRDSEEIIFGYERDGEDIIGIRSSTPSMISLFEDRLNETVIRNSKQI